MGDAVGLRQQAQRLPGETAEALLLARRHRFSSDQSSLLLGVLAEATLAAEIGLDLVRMAKATDLLARNTSGLVEDLVDVVPAVAGLADALVADAELLAVLALHMAAVVGVQFEAQDEELALALGTAGEAEQGGILAIVDRPALLVGLDEGFVETIRQLVAVLLLFHALKVDFGQVFQSIDDLLPGQQQSRHDMKLSVHHPKKLPLVTEARSFVSSSEETNFFFGALPLTLHRFKLRCHQGRNKKQEFQKPP